MLTFEIKICYNNKVEKNLTNGGEKMIINGMKIKRYQNFKKLDTYYFNAIKNITRESLASLSFVIIESHNVSKTTDSIYFKIKMNHHDEIFTVSLRNHAPQEVKENYFYIYLYQYENLSQLKSGIQKELINYYKKKASTLGILRSGEAYVKNIYSYNHNSAAKRKKSNKTKKINLDQGDSFGLFLEEFNQNRKKK